MSKGEMLDRIFKRMDVLNYTDKMQKLFIKNGMQTMDLHELKKRSEPDYKEWMRMYNRGVFLQNLITYTVLGK